MSEIISDFDLLTAGRAGDQRAARELYRRHLSPLQRHLEHEHDPNAADHAQEALVFLLTSDYRVTSSVRACLFAIARNRCREDSRNSANRERLLRGQNDRDAFDTLDDELAMSEALRQMYRRIADLSDELREVVQLRLGDLSLPEIASVLDVPEAVVKRRNAKAMRALERLLGEGEGPFRGDEARAASCRSTSGSSNSPRRCGGVNRPLGRRSAPSRSDRRAGNDRRGGRLGGHR
ncbi:MAG: sigma-70 family RNA polymerase sigma factor [Deltaproteobacteria bacterium]|nr:sigma-70 family RNA polymerase sigma factor [Deltaproteobacteria bacterium]